MNKPLWIIENIAKESSYAELAQACKDLGYETHEIVGDFSYDSLEYLIQEPRCVIFNGSIEMSKAIKNHLTDCYPVCFNTWANYECSNYYSHYGKYLFNDRYAMMTLNELGRNRWMAYGAFGKEALIFVRPSSGEKTFQAQLIDMVDLDRFIGNNQPYGHDLVVISSPKNINWEGRFVVSYENKEIIAHSTYRFQDQITKIPAVPKGAMEKCQEILNNNTYFPDKVFCIDLAEDSDGNFWLLELTSFSSAGLYSCCKKSIVDKVSKIAETEFEKEQLPF